MILVPVGWQRLVGTKSIFESHPYAGVAAIKKVFEPCNSRQRVPRAELNPSAISVESTDLFALAGEQAVTSRPDQS